MNDIQIFNNPQFGEIRTAGTAENPLFCLSDVCKVLELRVDGVTPRLKKDGVNRIGVIDSMGREQQAIFVSEQNLYKVIMRSDKPQAEPFQDWVCGEVLPSIRKHGAYMTEATIENVMNDPDSWIKLLTNLKEERELRMVAEQEQQRLASENTKKDEVIEKKDKVIESQHKFVSFAKTAFDSDSEIDIGEAAKILGLGYGRNTLFRKLRNDGILMSNNEPKQRYIDAGYFRLTQLDPIDMGKGKAPLIKTKTLVKQKGLAFLNYKYGNNEKVEMYKKEKAE